MTDCIGDRLTDDEKYELAVAIRMNLGLTCQEPPVAPDGVQ